MAKTAIITGGSRGIGKEVARTFLENGFRVIIFARDKKTLEKIQNELKKYGKVDAASLDVGNYKEVKKNIQKIKSTYGNIDILVNAAGVHSAIGFFPEVAVDKWQEAIRANLFGTVNMVHTVLSQMMKQGSGKIINFSGGGVASPRPFFSAYAASKAGIVNFTENLAEELKEKRFSIDVNVIAPGAINTRLLDEMIKAGPQRVGEKEYRNLLKQKKTGGNSAANVAELCLFLSSKESDGLSGKFISAVHDNWRDFQKYKKNIMNSDIYNLRRIKPQDRGYEW